MLLKIEDDNIYIHYIRCKQSPILVREVRDPWYISVDNYLHWYETFWIALKAKL